MAVDVTEYHLSGESPRQGAQPQAAAPAWDGTGQLDMSNRSLSHGDVILKPIWGHLILSLQWILSVSLVWFVCFCLVLRHDLM